MNKIKLWVDTITDTTLSWDEFNTSTQRVHGFVPNTVIDSKIVNTVLRQCTLVTAALIEALGIDNKDFATTLDSMKTAFQSKLQFTKIKVDNVYSPEVSFTSDPQQQIGDLNDAITGLSDTKTEVKIDGVHADKVSFLSDPQTQITANRTDLGNKTEVKINGVHADEVSFTSAPQDQIDTINDTLPNKQDTGIIKRILSESVLDEPFTDLTIVNAHPENPFVVTINTFNFNQIKTCYITKGVTIKKGTSAMARIVIDGIEYSITEGYTTDSDIAYIGRTRDIAVFIRTVTSIDFTPYVEKTDIVNNLDSSATNKPLSAAQGKALKEMLPNPYELPVARADVLGGVTAEAKSGQSLSVGIDDSGRLWTKNVLDDIDNGDSDYSEPVKKITSGSQTKLYTKKATQVYVNGVVADDIIAHKAPGDGIIPLYDNGKLKATAPEEDTNVVNKEYSDDRQTETMSQASRDIADTKITRAEYASLFGDPDILNYEYGIKFAKSEQEPFEQSGPRGGRVRRLNGTETDWNEEYTPNVGDEVGTTMFDNIPIFNPQIWTDKYGNKFSRFSRFYIKYEETSTHKYYWVCSQKLDGYHLPKAFYKGNTEYWNYVDIGCYEAGSEDLNGQEVMTSKSGKDVLYNKNRVEYNNYAKALNPSHLKSERYQITEISEMTEIFLYLSLIMFGTKNSQSKYNGVVSYGYTSVTPILAREAHKIYVAGNLTQANLDVGACFELTGDNIPRRHTVSLTTVTGTISDMTFTPGEGESYYCIELDGGELPAVTQFANRPIATGGADSDKLNFTPSNNGRKAMRILGIENPYGNIFKQILDISSQDHRYFVLKDIETFTTEPTNLFEDNLYDKVSYVMPAISGYNYDMGVDALHPNVLMPKAVNAYGVGFKYKLTGGDIASNTVVTLAGQTLTIYEGETVKTSFSTGAKVFLNFTPVQDVTTDLTDRNLIIQATSFGDSVRYWSDYFSSIGNNLAEKYTTYFGGHLNHSSNAGFSYWNCNNGVGNRNWNIGARHSSILHRNGERLHSFPLGKNNNPESALVGRKMRKCVWI